MLHQYPSQMDFPPITGMNNVFRPPNIRQPLKTLNRLPIPHTVTRSQDNTYSVGFQEHGPEHLIANGRYSYCFHKRVNLNQCQNKFLIAQHACLNTLTSSVK